MGLILVEKNLYPIEITNIGKFLLPKKFIYSYIFIYIGYICFEFLLITNLNTYNIKIMCNTSLITFLVKGS